MSHRVVIMRAMETTTIPLETVSGAWEPCVEFTDDQAPVCERCGWLRDEHDHQRTRAA